jgi:hypothetical protein
MREFLCFLLLENCIFTASKYSGSLLDRDIKMMCFKKYIKTENILRGKQETLNSYRISWKKLSLKFQLRKC